MIGNINSFLSQHLLNVKNGKIENSALAAHAHEHNHFDFTWDTPQILYNESNERKRLFKESVAILKHGISLNKQDEIILISPTYFDLLQHHVP